MAHELLRRLGYVDMARVAVHGHSMGAYVDAALVSAYPDDFRAASSTGGGVRPDFIISGPAPSPRQVRGVRTPYQMHHGDADTVVPLIMRRDPLAARLRKRDARLPRSPWSNSREVKSMTVAQAQTKPQQSSRFMEVLTTPWVDKTIAIIAVTPNAIELYHRYTAGNLSFPRAVLGINVLIVIITMVLRRPPVRVTPNPWYWLLAFVATYGLLFVNSFAWTGRSLVPSIVTNGLAVLSVAIFIYARLSLGRSIGMVPANRGIVTRGAYRFVRHPIYSGLFVAMLAFVLRNYSSLTLLMASTIVALFMLKSIVEERFLRADPEYAAYLQRVRRRWIPGIA